MATPCIITVGGKDYTPAEFMDMLVRDSKMDDVIGWGDKVYAKAKTLSRKQLKVERAKLLKKEPKNLRQAIMQFFLGGGKVNTEDVKRYLGVQGKDWSDMIGKHKNGGNKNSADMIARDFFGQFMSEGGESETAVINEIFEVAKMRKSDMEAELRGEKEQEDFYNENGISKAEYDRMAEAEAIDEIAKDEGVEIPESVSKVIDESVDAISDEEAQNEVNKIISTFTDSKGNIDWEKIKEEWDGFYPPILEMTNKAQQLLKTQIDESGRPKETKPQTSVEVDSKDKVIKEESQIGKTVTFKFAGNETKGVVKSIDENGNYQVVKADGTKHTVKPENARNAESVELAKKSLEENMKKLQEMTKPVTKTEEKPPQVNAVVPKDIFIAPMKVLGAGDKLIESVTNKIQDGIARAYRAATGTSNKYVSRASSEAQGIFRLLGLTEEDIAKRRKGLGQINAAPLKALNFYNNAVNIIGRTPESLRNVHQVLDPEVYQKRGETPKTEADLSPAEKQLYDLLRSMNNMIHDWHYANNRISEETYQKNKDTYAPRFYDNIEFEGYPEELKQAFEDYAKQQNFSYIKERKKFEDVMGENQIVEDPVYGTSMRLAQMMRNQAVMDYAHDIASRTKTYEEGDKNIPSSYVKLEGGGKFGNINTYGELTNKYVPRDIAEDFRGYFFISEAANQIYKSFRWYDRVWARQAMKKIHTLYNPLVQLGNIGSNYVFAMMNGLDAISFQSRKPEAARIVKEKGDLFLRLTEEGLLGQDITTADLKEASKGKPEKKGIRKALSDIDEKISGFYGSRDEIAKVAAYLTHTKDYGRSHDEAVKKVYEGFQNYSNVGRHFDFASKTPIIGNPFIKFKGDLIRIMKNNWSKRPLTNIALLAALNATATALSNWSDEDEDVRKIREGRNFIPKIKLPNALGGDIPLVWQTPYGEINAARYFAPAYIYDMGDKGSAVEEVSQYLPYQAESNKESGIPIPKIQDPFLGVYAQIAFDKDFRGKPILDPDANKFREGNATKEEKIQNAATYIARQQIPMFATAQDFEKAYNGEPDYYGRNRDLKQSLISNIIKVQEFGKKEALEQAEKDVTSGLMEMDRLRKSIVSSKSVAKKNIEKINKMNIPESKKDQLRKVQIDKAMAKIAELMSDTAEIKRKIIEPKQYLNRLK